MRIKNGRIKKQTSNTLFWHTTYYERPLSPARRSGASGCSTATPARRVTFISPDSMRETPEQVQKTCQAQVLEHYGLILDRIVKIAVVEMLGSRSKIKAKVVEPYG